MKNHAQKYRGMECFFENERGTAFVFFSQYSLGGQYFVYSRRDGAYHFEAAFMHILAAIEYAKKFF